MSAPLVQCCNCGVKLARSLAIARDGRIYCSEACLRLAPRPGPRPAPTTGGR